MKVTTEKLPKSLVALEIELDATQVEKGLDRAARKLSQKYAVPGFRKGKAPRFIIENYFGRQALMEEASEDLINKSFQEALRQEGLTPVGPASMEGIISVEPFRFRVSIPVPPTVVLPDYRSYRISLDTDPVTDEIVEHAMEKVRDRHVVLKELEEPRGAQHGDQLTVKLRSSVDGEPLNDTDENGEAPESTLILDPKRIVEDLYAGLLGVNVNETREVEAQMPDDHANEQVRGKKVVFNVEVLQIQERLVPDWEEIPVLEEYSGTLDEFRAKTRSDLETAARSAAERKVMDDFVDRLLDEAEFDVPDVVIHEEAHELLHQQGAQYERYGITLDQMLQYRGQTHEQAVEELVPTAERRVKSSLAVQQIVVREELTISEEELEAEVQRLLLDYDETARENVAQMLNTQLRNSVANVVMDRKIRELITAIASGNAPELPATADDDALPALVEETSSSAEE